MLAVKNSRWLIILMCMFVVGCATNRSALTLKSSTVTSANAVAKTGQTAVIRLVKDNRVFEQAPKDPSIPSLGFEGATNATAELKAKAVGRKRNGFGKAMGDITLQNGKTVEGVIKERLTLALEQAGYDVKQAGDVAQPNLVVDVNVKQFWAWFQPGFWAIALHTRIETDLSVDGAAAPVTVKSDVEESRQAATDGAWVSVLSKGLDDYQVKVTDALVKLKQNNTSTQTP